MKFLFVSSFHVVFIAIINWLSCLSANTLLSVTNCTDITWCSLSIPKESLFRFETPPNDENRWNIAKQQAADGLPVLLQKVHSFFPNYMDFINGDIRFREFHTVVDLFVDEIRDLTPLVKRKRNYKKSNHYLWEKDISLKPVLPTLYDFRQYQRAPVVKIGYFAFKRKKSAEFGGIEVGKALVSLSTFLKHWIAVKDTIDVPFITLDVHDENWGLLSTYLPNRTADWGRAFSGDQQVELGLLMEFLNHPMTLMLVVNQHCNVSHPKIVVTPRGLPLFKQHARRTTWDVMRHLLGLTRSNDPRPSGSLRSDKESDASPGSNRDILRKNQLVYTSSSSYGHRPAILSCVRDKFVAAGQAAYFEGSTYADGVNVSGRVNDLWSYYERLGRARVSIALPGIGYDTFRSVSMKSHFFHALISTTDCGSQ